jgi:hypothetical protein
MKLSKICRSENVADVVILEFELKTELYTSPDLLEDKFDSP